jgi:putative membrane protein
MKKMLAILLMAGCASFAAAQTVSDIQASQDQDKTFLKHAAEAGYAQVQLGELASRKASNPDVKAFAQKMVDDHTMLNNKLMPFDQQMGVKAPTSLDKKDQALYKALSGLSGDAFDKAYMKAMVEDHKKDLGDIKAEVTQTNNPDLSGTLKNGEHVIAGHYEMAQKLSGEVGGTPGTGTPVGGSTGR